MLKLRSLSSGSSGNSALLTDGDTRILIDVGIPLYEAENLLNESGGADNIDAVLITHRHSDHAGGARAFCKKYGVPAYYLKGSGVERLLSPPVKQVPFPLADFFIGGITVSPFALSHDVPCVGFSFLSAGHKVSVATDAGTLPRSTVEAISDSDIVLIEANHDESLLMSNPNYSPWLKARILSSRGHLSNNTCARVTEALIKGGASQIILGHLSEENNYPELAFTTVKNHLAACRLLEGRDYSLSIALRGAPSGFFQIG